MGDEFNYASQTITTVFFTHQYRLKIYVLDRFNALIENHNITTGAEKMMYPSLDFFNGCILFLRIGVGRLGLVGERTISLEMIHQGNITENTPKMERYFKMDTFHTTPPNVSPYVPLYVDGIILKRFFDIDINKLDPNIVYNVFFVRHGDAEHNTKYELIRVGGKAVKVPNVKINTDLTPLGIQQTKGSGIAFTRWVLLNYKKYGIDRIDIGFVSDLIRTQQTAANFFTGVIEESKIMQDSRIIDRNDRKKTLLGDFSVSLKYTIIVVLPCLNELESGSPDGSRTLMQGIGKFASAVTTLGVASSFASRENQTNCRTTLTEYGFKKRPYEAFGYTVKDCSRLQELGFPIDWTFYNNFYKGYRDQTTFGRDRCRNTHFLGIFFNIYLPQKLKLDTQFVEHQVRQKPDFSQGLQPPANPMPLLVGFNRNRVKQGFDDTVKYTIADYPYDEATRSSSVEAPVVVPTKQPSSWSRFSSWFGSRKGGKYHKKPKRKSRKISKKRQTRKNQRKQRK